MLHFLQVMQYMRLLNLHEILDGTMKLLPVVLLVILPVLTRCGQYLHLVEVQIASAFGCEASLSGGGGGGNLALFGSDS